MDIRTISRYGAVATLAVAGVAAAIPLVVTEDDDAPAAQQFDAYAAHSGVAAASNAMLVALIALVPAMVFAGRLARRGAPKLGYIGGALSALAWLAGLMSLGAQGIGLYEGSRLPDRAGAAALLDAMAANPVYNTLILIFVLGHVVGMVVLGIGLWRSGAVGWWVGALFILYVVLHTVGHALAAAVDVASGFVLAVALLAVAVRVARTPDAEWDLPAEPSRTAAREALPV
ncbi:MAG TPA: hypothetical protein VL738_15350 [Dactylosporangium sp.]|nr:hypothetical protein [Dactylosporangium sp.]